MADSLSPVDILKGEDPCDPWPLIMWNGNVCRLVRKENGVSPLPSPDLVARSYAVIEGWIPCGVFICHYAEVFD